MPAWGPVLGAQGVDQAEAYVEQLAGQPHDAALATAGKTVFETNCAACHGVDGKGNPLVGAPNLTDGVWLYGGDPATLNATITAGRNGQMPAFGERLGAERVRLLAAYAIHLSDSGS
jgi:cytochrome c oxidase cbb3-type subunit 3